MINILKKNHPKSDYSKSTLLSVSALFFWSFGMIASAQENQKIERIANEQQTINVNQKQTINVNQKQTINVNRKSTPINLTLSSIWEGTSIRSYNINAMIEIRKSFPKIKMIHFINPAYFTKANSKHEEIIAKIKSIIRPGDEIGMHLQPWRSLTQAADVIFRPGPTYWGETLSSYQCIQDCGNDVPLTIYRESEIRSILGQSIKIFQEKSLGKPKSFSAGGWLSSEPILEAIADLGFVYDYSSISPKLLKRRIGTFPLYQWIQNRWSHITPYTQPHYIKTRNSVIIEVSNSSAAIDYLTEKEVLEIFNNYISESKKNLDKTLLFQISFHQETAAQFLPRIKSTIEAIIEMGKRNSAVIRSEPIASIVELNSEASH
ncbi:MAG: hypothetical protein CMP10_16590 [Zetaproteobacteria bacterium]|nr:hypothetical protein [Pseudobdellovibrionaceae bacterium]